MNSLTSNSDDLEIRRKLASSLECTEVWFQTVEWQADFDSVIDECTVLFGMKTTNDRKFAIALSRSEQFAFIEIFEVKVGDVDVERKCIVTDIASSGIDFRNISTRFVTQIIPDGMSKAVDVGTIIHQSTKHVEVRPIAKRRVVEPVAAAGMMIRVEPRIFVADGCTKSDGVSWDRFWQIFCGSASKTTCFESVSVAEFLFVCR